MCEHKRLSPLALAAVLLTALNLAGAALAVTVENSPSGDVFVNGSLCLSDDQTCPPGGTIPDVAELQLHDTVPGIFFDDTSVSLNTDWLLRANDDSFFIRDRGTSLNRSNDVFKLQAGAPAGSFFMASNGNIGLGTVTPERELHIKRSLFPGIRISDATQDWEIEADSVSFAIFDATTDTRPLTVKPGAPDYSLFLAANGNIGLGTTVPAAPLQVLRTDGTAQVLVQELNPSEAACTLFKLVNRGNTKFEIVESLSGKSWAFTNSGSDFRVSLQGSGVVEFLVDNNGNAELAGALTQNSDVNAKQDIEAVDPQAVLDGVLALPVSRWAYKDAPDATHMGPMAQDFRAAFGLGHTPTGISSIDTGGVALAAIQGLNQRLQEQNEALLAMNQSLLERLEALENRLGLASN